MKASQYVHELGGSRRWIVAHLSDDGRYTARLERQQPGGVHSYQSRSILAVATLTRVYRSRAGALRAARRIYEGA
jgi:hypothetical protein